MYRSHLLLIVFVACAACGWQPAVSSAQTGCRDYRDYPLLESSLDLPGESFGMALQGDYLYLASGSRGLSVIDLTVSSQPVKIGSYNSPGQSRTAVAQGSLVYLADGDQGLAIIDVSNPQFPQLQGAVNTLGFVEDLVIRGNLAYLAASWGSGGLIIVDITDPTAPVQIGAAPSGGDARGIEVLGNYAYVADFSGVVVTFDISDPTAPVELSSFTTVTKPTALGISNGHLVVACLYQGIQVLSLTDPTQPQWLADFGPDQGLSGNFGTFVSCGDGRAAVLGSGYEVALIDLADPALPQLDSYQDTDHHASRALLSGDFLFTGDEDDGLEIKALTGWGQPAAIGAVSTQVNVQPGPIALYNDGLQDWALVASFSSGASSNRLNILDLASETYFSLTGYVSNGQRLYDVVVSGHHAYAAFSWVLLVVDIADPHDPAIVTEVPIPTLRRLAVDGNLLYCGSSDVFGSDTRVLDISDPTQPVELDAASHEGTVSGLAYAGDRLYITEENDAYIYDRTDPTDLVYLSQTTLTDLSYQKIQDIAVRGDYLYVCVDQVGVQIHDRRFINLPLVEVIALPDPRDVSFDQDIMYVSDLNRGLMVLDNTNPRRPEVLGYKNGQARASLPMGDRLLVSGQGFIHGLEAIPLQCDLLSPVQDELPGAHSLSLSAAPNPFNPLTRISLRAAQDGPVDLAVYDVAGRMVRRILAGMWLDQGEHQITWDGRDDQGRGLASGTYFLRMKSGTQKATRPITLLK